MDKTLQIDTLTIQLPKTDLSFLRSIGKRLGWKISSKKVKKTDYEKSLDDIKHGRITEYASVDEMFQKLGI